MIHGHGDDLYKSQVQIKANFSTNVWYEADTRPLCDFLSTHLEGIFHYPEPDAGSFRKVAAACHGLTPEQVLVGNGATELFYMVAHAFSGNRTLIPVPSFTEYEDACTLYDHHIQFVGQVDVEHIRAEDAFLAGQFVSYHVYPYYPDYLNYSLNPAVMDRTPIWDGKAVISRVETGPGTPIGSVLRRSDFYDETGAVNTYLAYLRALRRHHTMPVVISEFGVSTGRGMAQRDQNTGRNQGHMSEQEQGQALAECWEDIMTSGCAGGCVFTWQDEWFKRTWNTMHAVNLQRTPYWSDYQTNEQYFGLLSFDPGEKESVCYVDGDLSEWTEEDKLFDTGERALSMKYDERYIYLLAYQKGFANGEKRMFIPIDTTPKTGSTYCKNYGLRFDRAVDFVLAIDGRDNSRLLVQERYEVLRAMFYHETHDADAYLDPPDADTPLFKPIELMLQTATPLLTGNWQASSEVYETGRLLYGNANPSSPDFNSLADFIFAGDYVELKLPWQLLNFADPSRMTIHDDYYENYGVDYITIDTMNDPLTDGAAQDSKPLYPAALKGWGNRVTYHERLKASYDAMRRLWR